MRTPLATAGYTPTPADMARDILANVKPPAAPDHPVRGGRRNADKAEGEYSGGDVDYYRVMIEDPKRTDPYMAECEDIIEALNMDFAEGNAFKAIWRKAAQRTLGHIKRGADQHGVYDAQKVKYYGERQLVQAQRKANKAAKADQLAVTMRLDGGRTKSFTVPIPANVNTPKAD